jgi:hypothetical protein
LAGWGAYVGTWIGSSGRNGESVGTLATGDCLTGLEKNILNAVCKKIRAINSAQENIPTDKISKPTFF